MKNIVITILGHKVEIRVVGEREVSDVKIHAISAIKSSAFIRYFPLVSAINKYLYDEGILRKTDGGVSCELPNLSVVDER